MRLFLRLAVPADAKPAALVKAWEAALCALLDLDLSYPWASQKRRAKLRALAKAPRILEAIQGTAAHTENVKLDLLAVLVIDGSPASIDALIPHIDPALVHQDRRLDRLTRLRTYAKPTPALEALLAELDGAVAARNAVSPALALGPIIGIGDIKPLWFTASIWSRETGDGNIARIQAHVGVDSRKPSWFSIDVAAVHHADHTRTSFTATTVHQDELRIGRCEPERVPAWLASAARNPARDVGRTARPQPPAWSEAPARRELARRPLNGSSNDGA